MTNGSLLVDLIQSHIRTPASPLAPPFQDSNSCHNEP
jgi:hypothetical protein